MNVLVISNLFPPYSIGGYEIACEEIVRSFTDDTVTVLTTSYGLPGPAVDGDVARVLPNVFGTWPSGPLLLPCGWRRFFLREAFDITDWWVRRVRPDVCYVWNLQGLSLGPVAAARLRRVPVVYHFEDTWLPDIIFHPRAEVQRVKYLLGHPLAVRGRTGAIFVSDYLRGTYASRGFVFGRSKVIYNGVEPGQGTDRRRDPAGLRLLFAGRIVPDKGLDVLIEALSLVHEEMPGAVQLTVAGDGEPEYVGSLQDRASGLVSTWLGRVDRQELRRLYRCHDLLVVPSVWDEPFGLVAAEAMAAGTPVVATRSGGLPEIVRPGVNGWLVPRGDPRALAETLASVAQFPSSVREYGVRAAIDARARFDLGKTRAAARAFIDEVVEG